jgi:hypothetical protein
MRFVKLYENASMLYVQLQCAKKCNRRTSQDNAAVMWTHANGWGPRHHAASLRMMRKRLYTSYDSWSTVH